MGTSAATATRRSSGWRSAKLLKGSPPDRSSSHSRTSRSTCALTWPAGHPPQQRHADRGARALAPAQEEVVGLLFLALHRALAQRRALEADIADPVLGAGVRAAVEVDAEVLDLLAEGGLQMVHDLDQPRLG